MPLYNTLLALSKGLYDLRADIITAAVNMRDVFIIGEHVTPVLLQIAAYISVVAGRIGQAAGDWLQSRNEIMSALSQLSVLQSLRDYVNTLKEIAAAPGTFVRNSIKNFIPELWSFSINPLGYIINKIKSGGGALGQFFASPQPFLNTIIGAFLGDVVRMIPDPRKYIIDKLVQVAPGLRLIFANPLGWLRSEFVKLAPGLNEFLNNPEDYITDKIMSAIEKRVDKWKDRAAAVVELILNRIF